jgi:23S rRNA (cytidine2498-2'-O)-methyltransferase
MTPPAPQSTRLHLVRSGFIRYLARELGDAGAAPTAQGPTWLLTGPTEQEFCFSYLTLIDPVELTLATDSVNAAAKLVLDYFLGSCRDEKFTAPWPCQFRGDETVDGLARRATAVERTFLEGLTKRIARVARLAQAQPEKQLGHSRGLFVFWRDFTHCYVAREAILGGQQRMADDPGAPSRSYLKLEEAYGILGKEPKPGESVVDLGAAPGGWSFSAAKRGAKVLALDNGPLKGAALNHPNIRHELTDAFRYAPPPGQPVDWLLCDVVDEPAKVMALLNLWVTNRACRRFVVNFKFGRTDPIPLLKMALSPTSPFSRACIGLRARHLFHDREEFTLVGELRG